MSKTTNNGKRGGALDGKPHYDSKGNEAGGIKAIVTDANGKPVELEAGEVIINKHASKKHWKLLSKINQSAGNGVPIHNPSNSGDEDPEETYEGGGNIDFNVNDIPNKWIMSYAAKIKKKHPEIWKLGGNVYGNEAYENLKRVSQRGHWLDSEDWMYKKWRSFLARHQHDFRIAGVVAMLKWGGKVNKGWPYMKSLIEDEINKKAPKPSLLKSGGNVVTYKDKFNKKYGFAENESHGLAEIATITKIKLSALQEIYDKGIGAYKTNPQSVRANVKSKEQWAMARVYSSVMGGKAAKVDANELRRGKKLMTGGNIEIYDQPKSYSSKIEAGQRYFDQRYQDFYTIEKITPVDGGDVDVTLEYDKGKTRTESGNFLLYHIDAKQHLLSKEPKSPTPTMEQTETIKAIRELGTGAKVYFETPKYRVNENLLPRIAEQEFILIVGRKEGDVAYNYYFDNVEMPVFIAKELLKIYPNGVPDAVLVDRLIEMLEKKFNGVEDVKISPDEGIIIVPEPSSTHGISTNVKDYKNPYQINRAIERLLDIKGREQENYTVDEISFIGYYSGYGGLEKMGKGEFSDDELKGLLYEYYTPDEIVQKMWALAYKNGYGTLGDNSVFEPSVGVGAFLKYAPENVFIAANEINKYSAMICHVLYPHVETTLMPFEKNFLSRNESIKNKLENLKKYSLVIGNPPYGKLGGPFITRGEDVYSKAANWVEYFIFRGLDLLQKDGLLMYIVGAEQYTGGTLFLDSALTKTKKAIFEKADLIDAYRLPNKLFERTGVSSEIVIFKKR